MESGSCSIIHAETIKTIISEGTEKVKSTFRLKVNDG